MYVFTQAEIFTLFFGKVTNRKWAQKTEVTERASGIQILRRGCQQQKKHLSCTLVFCLCTHTAETQTFNNYSFSLISPQATSSRRMIYEKNVVSEKIFPIFTKKNYSVNFSLLQHFSCVQGQRLSLHCFYLTLLCQAGCKSMLNWKGTWRQLTTSKKCIRLGLSLAKCARL